LALAYRGDGQPRPDRIEEFRLTTANHLARQPKEAVVLDVLKANTALLD
jgi:hypothetical protein